MPFNDTTLTRDIVFKMKIEKFDKYFEHVLWNHINSWKNNFLAWEETVSIVDTYICGSPATVNTYIDIYPAALILFEQSNCIDWINLCCILSLIKIQLFWYPCHMLLVEFWETSCRSSSLPVDRKYQKGQSRDDWRI